MSNVFEELDKPIFYAIPLNSSSRMACGFYGSSDLMLNLICDQLVMDFLHKKYIDESPKVSLNDYAKSLSKSKIFIDRKISVGAIKNEIKRSMNIYYKRINPSEPENSEKKEKYKNQLMLFGVNAEEYYKHIAPVSKNDPDENKSEFDLDWYFYNLCHFTEHKLYNLKKTKKPDIEEHENTEKTEPFCMITQKQFERKLKVDSNTKYGEFFSDLNDYHEFVESIFEDCFCDCKKCEDNSRCDYHRKRECPKYEKPEIYFKRIMKYYRMEFDKRVDYIIKLSNLMGKLGMPELNKDYFMLKSFTSEVQLVQENYEYLDKPEKFIIKYFTPMLMIECELIDIFWEECEKRNLRVQDPKFKELLIRWNTALYKHQLVRSKAYELLVANYELDLSDYDDIKDFLEDRYNMISYHHNNENTWKMIKNNAGKLFNHMDDKEQIKNFTNRFISISNLFFPTDLIEMIEMLK